MRNPQAVVIRKAVMAIGVGLLEQALQREGSKGCSAFLCSEPVSLEPPFRVFDSEFILGQTPGRAPDLALVAPKHVDYQTFDVYPAEEDLLSLDWMETMLRALSVLRGPMAFELFGRDGRVWVRYAVPGDQVVGFKASLLGHFPALILRTPEVVFPERAATAVNELVPVGPYHRSLTLLGQEGSSPLALAAGVLSDLPPGDVGVLQILLTPTHPDHDWHYNVETMVEAEERAANLAQLGGLSRQFSYDQVLPPLSEPTVRAKVRKDTAFFTMVARYAVWSDRTETAEAFLQGMRVSTGLLRFGNRVLRALSHDDLVGGLGEEAVDRMVRERLTHRPGLPLTSHELASLVHLPNARSLAMLASLEQRSSLPWRAVEAESPGDLTIGTNTFAGETVPVVVPSDLRLQHTYLIGTTGSGKSSLQERMAVDDAYAGSGFCLVDPHGDLCMDVLSRLPEERIRATSSTFRSPSRGWCREWNPFRSNVTAAKLADDMARAFMAQNTFTLVHGWSTTSGCSPTSFTSSAALSRTSPSWPAERIEAGPWLIERSPRRGTLRCFGFLQNELSSVQRSRALERDEQALSHAARRPSRRDVPPVREHSGSARVDG